jgi:hypothetical protein
MSYQIVIKIEMSLPIITLQKLAAESGYTEDALRSKIARGEFAEGLVSITVRAIARKGLKVMEH